MPSTATRSKRRALEPRPVPIPEPLTAYLCVSNQTGDVLGTYLSRHEADGFLNGYNGRSSNARVVTQRYVPAEEKGGAA